MKKRDKIINTIIKSLSKDWRAEERETSILYDHSGDIVLIETSEPYTARRLYDLFKNDPNIKFDERADTLKFSAPLQYARKPELVFMAKYR